MSAACKSCGAQITWARTRDATMPLDAEVLDGPPAAGMVMLNSARGTCQVLTAGVLCLVDEWRKRGATLHRSHFETCPSADRHRVHPEQEQLPL